jgi:hypothetical protein
MYIGAHFVQPTEEIMWTDSFTLLNRALLSTVSFLIRFSLLVNVNGKDLTPLLAKRFFFAGDCSLGLVQS